MGIEQLHQLCSYRVRKDRKSSDLLVVREYGNGLGGRNREVLLASGRFHSRRRGAKVKTFATLKGAKRAVSNLSGNVVGFPEATPTYTIMSAVQFDKMLGTWDQDAAAPIVARYSDVDLDLSVEVEG